jgi:hypothetical protein
MPRRLRAVAVAAALIASLGVVGTVSAAPTPWHTTVSLACSNVVTDVTVTGTFYDSRGKALPLGGSKSETVFSLSCGGLTSATYATKSAPVSANVSWSGDACVAPGATINVGSSATNSSCTYSVRVDVGTPTHGKV